MADGIGISAKWFYKPTVNELKAHSKRVDRATMWGLREVGRQVRRQSAKRAPVYKGGRADKSAPQPGLLKKSIRSSRQLRRDGDGYYRMTVGPRGDRVRLYAQKIEKQTGYMREGHEAAMAEARVTFEKAWGKAMSR